MPRFVVDAGAFATLDEDLARRLPGIVPTAPIDAPGEDG
jgi:hypothetical protein